MGRDDCAEALKLAGVIVQAAGPLDIDSPTGKLVVSSLISSFRAWD